MIRPATIVVLTGVLAVGAFAGAAIAQTALPGAKVVNPLPQVNSAIPTGSTSVDFMAIGKGYLTGLPTGGSVTIGGTNIGIGAYNIMDPTSSLNVGVGTVPAGNYLVKVTFVNVARDITLTVAEGINTKTCALVARGGYQNEQSCAVPISSNGRGFNVRISFTGEQFSQATLKVIDVAKVR